MADCNSSSSGTVTTATNSKRESGNGTSSSPGGRRCRLSCLGKTVVVGIEDLQLVVVVDVEEEDEACVDPWLDSLREEDEDEEAVDSYAKLSAR